MTTQSAVKDRDDLWVDEIPGEAMRFRVESRGSPEFPHTVDLLAHGGLGECSCRDWEIVCFPNYRQGGRRIGAGPRKSRDPQRTRCCHVEAARELFLNELLARMAEQK